MWIPDGQSLMGREPLGLVQKQLHIFACHLQIIFDRASIAKSSEECCYSCGFVQSAQPNLI